MVKVTDRQLMGGVMKLGKALATGVAQEEEQPRPAEEETPAEAVRVPEETPAATAPEEVPAAR
ncbi:hypothetical protein [Streptomyces sp. NRRL S-340]|uniref:hypothetical protein n=1 Tax=Streptomyces sp. NRRL S-340 TaxID=1463901 RepID=UPI000B270C78|nr:hypothetical protein [Streptomyces sp. NRRL S-340]